MTEAILVVLWIGTVLHMTTKSEKECREMGTIINDLRLKLYNCEEKLRMYEEED